MNGAAVSQCATACANGQYQWCRWCQDETCDLNGVCEGDVCEYFHCSQECITVFGLEHCPVGQATLHVDAEGNLVISNIGSGGDDGVSIAVPPRLELLDIATVPLGDPSDPGNPIPDGAVIEVTAKGTIGGVPDLVVSAARYEDTGPQVTANLDFSSLAPTSLSADHFCEKTLVHQESVQLVAPTYFLDIWPDTFGVSWIDIYIDWEFSCHPVTTPGGASISTDLIIVDAVEPGNPHTDYSRVVLTAKDIPTITITGETLIAPRVPTISEWGVMVLTLLLLTAGKIVFGRRRRTATA